MLKNNKHKGRLTFEQIRNTKEQIYFYERAENHKAKEHIVKHLSVLVFNILQRFQKTLTLCNKRWCFLRTRVLCILSENP